MKTQTYHVFFDAKSKERIESNFSDVVASLGQIGFRPVFQEARELVANRLKWLGATASDNLFGPDDLEILVSQDEKIALLARLRRAHYYYDDEEPVLPALDLLLVAQDDVNETEERIKKAIALPLEPHSSQEARSIRRLQEQFGGLSPNGKFLSDVAFRNTLRRLYDDQLRERMSLIVSTFRDNPASLSALQRLDLFSKETNALQALLNDYELVSAHYIVYCRECDTSHLSFLDRATAEMIISNSQGRCASCNKRKLEVLETYAVTEPFLRGIQQGLWLESLAGDTLALRANAVWTGQMIENNEIDVLSVHAENTILVECKDTSFGQNDLYVTLVKAQQVQADIVIIVSTRNLHQNVSDIISKMGRQNREQRKFRTITSSSSITIQDELNNILDQLAQEQIKRWIRPEEEIPF